MNWDSAFFLAFRTFRPGHRKKKSSRPLLAAIFGIALGLVPLIVVIHISDGMIEGITGRYIETYSYHMQLFSYASPSLEEYQELARQVESLDQVERAVVERRGFGLAYSEEGRSGVTIRALEEDLHREDARFREFMEVRAGEWDLESERAIILGEEVARQLQVQPGDSVKILTGRVFSNGRYVPKITPFVVTAVVSSGYQELDRMWVFVPLEKGLRILSDDSSENIIGIKTQDPYGDLDSLVYQIGGLETGSNNWRASTWMNLNRTQQKSYQTTKMLLQIIMALLVLVAVMNVASSLVMLVLENSHDIGIQKCVGAAPADIGRIYRLIGLCTGILGSFIGTALGIIISAFINQLIGGIQWFINIFIRLFSWISQARGTGPATGYQLLDSAYYLEEIPVDIQWFNMAIIMCITILLAWIASAIPAWRAGRIRPLEVIRKH